VIGHYLLTGGDWRAAVWGVVSLGLAMVVYWPFAKAAERQRLAAASSSPSLSTPPTVVEPVVEPEGTTVNPENQR
jgi:hypothetical protein